MQVLRFAKFLFLESLSECVEYDITTATDKDDQGDVRKRKRKRFSRLLDRFCTSLNFKDQLPLQKLKIKHILVIYVYKCITQFYEL